jgi:hypothetical protein
VTPQSIYVVCSGSLLVISVVVFIAALRVRARVLIKYQELAWARLQIERAIKSLASEDVDDVLSGLQTLRALGVSIDETTLRRLTSLLAHDNQRVAAHAEETLFSLSQRAFSAASRG